MRVQQEPSFILHTRPYSETSLYTEVFSKDYGRLTLTAKGARRQKSQYRGLLLPFQELSISWSGRGEIPTLTSAEFVSKWRPLNGGSIYCGFYINELLSKLLHRHEAHPGLYTAYVATMDQLSDDKGHEIALRIFEKRLLSELGYAMNLAKDAKNNKDICENNVYRYVPQIGAVSDNEGETKGIRISGAALIALEDECFTDPRQLKECKALMRAMIAHQMVNKTLYSRKLFL